jgi:hypothetical protein
MEVMERWIIITSYEFRPKQPTKECDVFILENHVTFFYKLIGYQFNRLKGISMIVKPVI